MLWNFYIDIFEYSMNLNFNWNFVLYNFYLTDYKLRAANALCQSFSLKQSS